MRELLKVLGICATVAVLFWLLVYTPVQAEISTMRLQTRQLQLSARELDSLQTRYGNFADFVAATDERLTLAQEFLPAALDDEKFTARLYQIAENKKFAINSVQLGENSGDTLTVRLRFDADYISLLNFVREVLDGDRLVRLENYSIDSDGDFLSGELEFVIFAAKN